MKIINFAKRNFKELLRDPANIIFSIALPLFFLIIFQQFNIPSTVYKIENFTPSIIIFSYTFITLFTAQLVANDRCSSLLARLFASPMKPMDYILGYALALIPLAIAQNILFFITAMFFKLPFNVHVILTILILIPISILFISLGILIGCIANNKQAPTLGSLLVQVVAFTSGMWFSIDMAGKVFKIICKVLPFSHAIDLSRMVLNNLSESFWIPLLIVISYTLVTFILAIIVFKRKMISDNK